jgi:RNA polymerase sigma-70 factor (ECF subfamily)
MDQKQDSETREHLARLWGKAEASVQAYVFSAVNGFQDAEDVVQEIAMAVARRFHEYDPSRPFVAWALWLAKSQIVEHYRRRGRERLAFSDLLLDKIAAALIDRQGERSARQAALEQCLEKLPQKSRRLLDLRYVEENSIESVAREIQSTAGSVRVMLFRIRDVLSRCIQSQLVQAEVEG